MRDLAVEAARGQIRMRAVFRRDWRQPRRRGLAPDRVADRMLRTQRGAGERPVDRHGSVEVCAVAFEGAGQGGVLVKTKRKLLLSRLLGWLWRALHISEK